MAGFLKRIFGGGADNENAPKATEPDDVYKGVEVFAQPVKDEGQWRVAGLMRKSAGGETIERRFMRADLLPDEASAKTTALGKARLIIDQNGDGLWTGDDRMV